MCYMLFMFRALLTFAIRSWSSNLLWVCLLLSNPFVLGAAPASGQPGEPSPGQETLSASIYESTGNPPRVLFRFRRVATRSGATVNVLREFLYPDGKPAVREQVVYEGAVLRTYRLEELQTGGIGVVKVEQTPGEPGEGWLFFEYIRNAQSPAIVKREPLVLDTLVGDMVGSFLASHWERLQQGQSVSCRYVVTERAETVAFSFKKDSESKWKGRDVIVVKMQPRSPFISALVDPLYFYIEKSPPHRVLQYVGRTVPKKLQGKTWKDLDAVTVFDWPDLNGR
jgi:hypothetical protein